MNKTSSNITIKRIIKSVNVTAYGGINITTIKIKNYKIINKTYRYILNSYVASGFVIDRPVERGALLSKKGEFVIVGMTGKEYSNH